MNRHRSLPVAFLVAGFAASGFGLVALSQGATAHTPAISASCSGLVLQASNYDGRPDNVWSVTIDGSTTSGTFAGSLDQTFPVPQDRVFSWSGRIAGWDGNYADENSGTLGPCVTPTEEPTTEPPTTEPPTEEPTTEPPTTEPPTTPTEPPTTPTEPPTTPTEPPTTPTEPPTTPTSPPTTVDPTSETETPTTETPTDEPTTEVPTTVLDDGGTRGGDEGEGGNNPPTLPDTGASVSAPFELDQGMVPMSVARGSLMAGVLLLLVGAWQLWRRETA